MSQYFNYNFDNVDINSLTQMKISLVNDRKILIDTEINENCTLNCMYYFNKIKEIDKKYSYHKKEPIEIYINSNGGYASECFVIVDLIEQMKKDGYEIITINMGRAFSAGMAIALCGSTRKAFKRARYMFHDVSSNCIGKYQEMYEQLEEINKTKDTYFDIIKSYTNITDDDIRIWQDKKNDKFFSAEEMYKLKGIEEIL